jgi:formylglycine-generating enzyme required for sulfatase activity
MKDKPVPVSTTPVVEKKPEPRAVRKPRRRPQLPSGRPIPWRWIAGAAGLVAVAIILFVLVLNGGGGEDAERGGPLGPTAPPALGIGSITERERDGAVMVYVPGGTFEMGSTEGDDDEQPVHSVTLDSFWIDKHEVTNAQFAAFLNERGNQTEDGETWLDLQSEYCLIEQVDGEYRPKSGYDSHPVIEVTWYGARAYCEWAGARLPTEAEWEYAARGPQGNTYPWGDTFDGERLNFCDVNCPNAWKDTGWDDGYERTAPVGSFEEGASWCGALDMVGNVLEWVADWYQEDYYAVSPDSNPLGPETGKYRVLRGGSWNTIQDRVRSAYRDRDYPVNSVDVRGFRCVGAATSISP